MGRVRRERQWRVRRSDRCGAPKRPPSRYGTTDMSAPTPAPGDDRPREGYYPDPSIPGYVRYWNGASWVPGTSRPAPLDGVPLASPPGSHPASVPAQAQAPAPAEETGPHFFDEDPQPSGGSRQVSPAEAQHGSRPEPAAAWGADRSRQTGFGGERDRRVAWGRRRAPPTRGYPTRRNRPTRWSSPTAAPHVRTARRRSRPRTRAAPSLRRPAAPWCSGARRDRYGPRELRGRAAAAGAPQDPVPRTCPPRAP